MLLLLVPAFLMGICVVLVGCEGPSAASSGRMESMVARMAKMRMEDLQTSGSGYAYNQQQGLPLSYVQYTNHGSGRYYDAPAPVRYVAPVAPVVPEIVAYPASKITPHAQHGTFVKGEPVNYAVPQLSGHLAPLISKVPAQAPYFVVDKSPQVPEVNVENYTVDREENYGDATDPRRRDENENGQYENESVDDSDEYDNDRSFDTTAGGGSKHENQEYSSHGEKGEKGYENREEFDKGEHEEHSSEKESGHYSDEAGNEKGFTDSAGNYGEYHEEQSKHGGSDSRSENYHKKGEKTKGYHNVYHKDEYKKDTTFYDEDHKDGSYEKYSSANEHHGSKEGGFEKGHSHRAAFNNQRGEKDGHYDKGHQRNHEEGHDNEEGNNSYHESQEGHSANSESNNAEKHGYSESRKHY